jgi:hypothetical protein
LSVRNHEVLEWQANTMAGLCAAPMWLVKRQICLRLQPRGTLRYIGPRRYWLRGLPFEVSSFEDYCRCIATIIKPWFGGLSAQSLGYRVQRSRLVYDATVRRAVLLRAC